MHSRQPPNPSDPRETARRMQEMHHPTRIGDYKILGTLGEGGMGVVYLAQQEEPQRKVALKVIKVGMDTRQVVARFESERQALALMNHPNVAQVYDAGETQEGRPFFVMEHVPGVSITTYCDQNRLNIEERIRLCIDVCNAVQHAHQKGLIHRDIKPSNILVLEHEGVPHAKVIDFGVTKATQQRLTDRTLYTEQGQLIGTPGYMSPEQADMSALDVDTRSDIYSLGAVLYELLVGVRPFDDQMLRDAGFAELQRIIREVDPLPPSARLRSLGPSSTMVAMMRRTEPRILIRQLRHDLDWIVMKCLEKQRSRRYATANALAVDLQQYLRNEPVQAGPPSRIYNALKFARKHRRGVAAFLLLFGTVLTGFVISTELYLRSEEERQRADAEAAKANYINNFLVDLFRLSDPGEARGNTITVREVLDRGAARLPTELGDQPALQTSLMHTIGDVYVNLGLFPQARVLAERALNIRRSTTPTDLAAQAQSMCHLATILSHQGNYAEAEKMHREALRIRRQSFNAPHAAIADSLEGLGLTLHRVGKVEEARECYNEALQIRRTLFGSRDARVARSLLDAAAVARDLRQYDHAQELLQEALNIQLSLFGGRHPDIGDTLLYIAATNDAAGNTEEAERGYRRALAVYQELLAPESLAIGSCLSQIAKVLIKKERFEEAEPLLREALIISERRLGTQSGQFAFELNLLGEVLCHRGEAQQALELHRRSLDIWLKNHGPEYEMTAASRLGLGEAMIALNQLTAAETELKEALRVLRQRLGDDHYETVKCAQALARLYGLLNKFEEASAYEEMVGRAVQSEKP